MSTYSLFIKTNILLVLLFADLAIAQDCAVWNQQNNQVEYPQGTPIGIADVTNDNRIENFQGGPLSQAGVSCVVGLQDGVTYDPDDLGKGEVGDDDDEIDIDIDPCIIPGNPFCQDGNDGGGSNGGGNEGGGSNGGGSNGGGSNGGGSNGGGSNGGGSNGGGTASAAQVVQAMSVPKNPIAQGSGGGGGGSFPATAVTLGGYGDDVASGPNGERQRLLAMFNDQSARLIKPNHSEILLAARNPKRGMLDLSLGSGGGASSRTAKSLPSERRNIPSLFKYTNWKKLNKPNDMGVDAEILKTAMAVHQPGFRTKLDYLNGKDERDQYLDQGLTLKGVTHLAMSFLDKTLAEGLHENEMQATQDTQSHLMKQVSWSLERLAAPEHAQSFIDRDEKLEACLETALVDGKAQKQIKGKRRKRVEFACDKKCGDAPTGQGKYRGEDNKDFSKHGNGSLRYCYCCAETSTELNRLAEDQRQPIALEGESNKIHSLVDRAFFGVSPESTQQGEVGKVYKEFVETYKMLFGDVVMKEVTEGEGDPYHAFITQSPLVSPVVFTALHKNRCYTDGDDEPHDTLSEKGTCGIPDEEKRFEIKYGVCPALLEIADKFEQITSGKPVQNIGRYLAEASMGMIVTGDLMRGFIAKHSVTKNKIEKRKERLELATALEAFCDASAVAAVTRQLATYQRLTSDALTLNSFSSGREKAMVQQLLERYFEAVRLHQVDEQSRFAAYAVGTGISLAKDRALLANFASAQQAFAAEANNNANRSGMTSMLAGTLITGNSGAGSARIAPNFKDAFGEKGSRVIDSAARDISKYDPINNGISAKFDRAISSKR